MNNLLKVITEARESVPEERPTANVDFEDILFDPEPQAEQDHDRGQEPGLKRTYTYSDSRRSSKDASSSIAKLKEDVVAGDVPWLPREYVAKMARLPYLTRLNLEILQYVAYCTLTEAEVAARTYVLNQIQDIILLVLPTATIDVFGSYSTGMATYASDIDICVNFPFENEAVMRRYMHSVATLLRSSISTNYVDVRDNARVPIIKGVHDELLLEYDISFNSPNGVAHRQAIQQYIEKHPLARVLLIIIKSFLKKRGLNQPYTGGMSSYILLQLIMVYISERHNVFPYSIPGESISTTTASEGIGTDSKAFIAAVPTVDSMQESNSHVLAKLHRGVAKKQGKDTNSLDNNSSKTAIEDEILANKFHATSLIEFFELFGTIYNAESLTIYTNPRGNASFITPRHSSGYYHQSLVGSPPLLSVLNSNDPTNECAGGVTRYRYIRSSFEIAYFYLLRNNSGSILSFLVDIDFAAMHSREKCKEWFGSSGTNAFRLWAEKLESLISLQNVLCASTGSVSVGALSGVDPDECISTDSSETLSEETG